MSVQTLHPSPHLPLGFLGFKSYRPKQQQQQQQQVTFKLLLVILNSEAEENFGIMKVCMEKRDLTRIMRTHEGLYGKERFQL